MTVVIGEYGGHWMLLTDLCWKMVGCYPHLGIRGEFCVFAEVLKAPQKVDHLFQKVWTSNGIMGQSWQLVQYSNFQAY